MNQSRGFTLIELAIVLVIITFLIGGLAAPLSSQIKARRLAETRNDMRAIQDALIGYAMSKPPGKPHLPCPDDGSGAEPGDEGERELGVCKKVRGGLPWRALGLGDSDAWGNRYTYAVSQRFTDENGFSSSETGTLNVYDKPCSGGGVPSVAVVVVSHGPNGRGAQNKSGGTPLSPAEVPANERANLAPSPASCGEENFVNLKPLDNDFDDLVVWLHPNILRHHLCQDGCPPPSP